MATAEESGIPGILGMSAIDLLLMRPAGFEQALRRRRILLVNLIK